MAECSWCHTDTGEAKACKGCGAIYDSVVTIKHWWICLSISVAMTLLVIALFWSNDFMPIYALFTFIGSMFTAYVFALNLTKTKAWCIHR